MSKRSSSLREEFLELLERDRGFRYAVAGFLGLDEVLKRLDKHGEELVKLREDMNKLREDMMEGFALIDRHVSALGARWGLMSEGAFREGLKGLLDHLGLRVERWVAFDEEGGVYSYPSNVEVDIAITDEEVVLVEVKSHARASDVILFKRKAEFYIRKTGKTPSRLLIVTPYADESALEAAKALGVEICTKV